MSDLMLDVDQAGELKAAFRRANYTNAEIKKLSEGNILAQVRNVLKGVSIISPMSHVIDCDANPYIPNNWKVEEHQKGGMWQWDLKRVSLYFSKSQKKEKTIIGNDLRKELQGKPVLNANVLDYLLKHPELIPEEWKNQYIFFWGTIYRGSGGSLCVRYLGWRGDRWSWGCHWLGSGWNSTNPAVLRVS
jgi:hypothetical protein